MHTYPDDIDVLLVGPGGQNAILMSDAGGGITVNDLSLTLDDAAATELADEAPLGSGTFRPTNWVAGDTFPAPAPSPSGNVNLSVFNGTDPTGTWSLYVLDDAEQDQGTVANGWTLFIGSDSPHHRHRHRHHHHHHHHRRRRRHRLRLLPAAGRSRSQTARRRRRRGRRTHRRA